MTNRHDRLENTAFAALWLTCIAFMMTVLVLWAMEDERHREPPTVDDMERHAQESELVEPGLPGAFTKGEELVRDGEWNYSPMKTSDIANRAGQ